MGARACAYGPYHAACSYEGAGLGDMPVLAVRGRCRMGRGARLEAQVRSCGRWRLWANACSVPFNLQALALARASVRPPGACVRDAFQSRMLAEKHDERTHDGRARRVWRGVPTSDCPTFGATMLAARIRISAYALMCLLLGEVTGEQGCPRSCVSGPSE